MFLIRKFNKSDMPVTFLSSGVVQLNYLRFNAPANRMKIIFTNNFVKWNCILLQIHYIPSNLRNLKRGEFEKRFSARKTIVSVVYAQAKKRLSINSSTVLVCEKRISQIR